jgi:hypothetical protein
MRLGAITKPWASLERCTLTRHVLTLELIFLMIDSLSAFGAKNATYFTMLATYRISYIGF